MIIFLTPTPMKELTKAEEQIMHVLWRLKKGFINDIIAELPEPKPAYSTVSTVVRVLEQKGFVAHNAYGHTHEYYPLTDKDTYTHAFLRNFTRNYFSNSFKSLASFFTHREDLSLSELEEIRHMIEQRISERTRSKL